MPSLIVYAHAEKLLYFSLTPLPIKYETNTPDRMFLDSVTSVASVWPSYTIYSRGVALYLAAWLDYQTHGIATKRVVFLYYTQTENGLDCEYQFINNTVKPLYWDFFASQFFS